MATLVRFWNDQSLPALLMTGVRLHKVRCIFFALMEWLIAQLL